MNIILFCVQIVQTTRLVGPDNPLEIIYFVEGANGKRLPATTTANMLNSLDMQHAAIVMGYRIQEILAQRKPSNCNIMIMHKTFGTVFVSNMNLVSTRHGRVTLRP